MQRILASIILSFLICSPLWSLSWSSVNIDKVTAAAMSAAYETETLVEGNTASNINKSLIIISLQAWHLPVSSRA